VFSLTLTLAGGNTGSGRTEFLDTLSTRVARQPTAEALGISEKHISYEVVDDDTIILSISIPPKFDAGIAEDDVEDISEELVQELQEEARQGVGSGVTISKTSKVTVELVRPESGTPFPLALLAGAGGAGLLILVICIYMGCRAWTTKRKETSKWRGDTAIDNFDALTARNPDLRRPTYMDEGESAHGGFVEMASIELETIVPSGKGGTVAAAFSYVVKEPLETPLPEPWEKVLDDAGEAYYWNTVTDETTYNRPEDTVTAVDTSVSDSAPATQQVVARESISVGTTGATGLDGLLNPAWRAVETAEGETYYWNETTNETSWVKPIL
jgi:hypothetical protein